MLALVNAPSSTAKVALAEVPAPQPAANEALIEVSHFSLNRGELRRLEHRPEGWVGGQDVAGRVVVAAADGSGPPAGARVVALVESGGWAERVAVRSHSLAVLPEGVSFEQAACLPVAGVAALRAVRLLGALLGRRVLVSGASGGFGHLAVQLARVAGGRVTALARPENAAWLGELGAERVVSDLLAPDSVGELFEAVIESVGGETFRQALRRTAPEAVVALVGSTSGEDARFQIYDFFGHEGVRLQSVFMYTNPERHGAELAELVRLAAQGQLRAEVGWRGSWRAFDQGAEHLRARNSRGKVVFSVS